MNSIKRQARAYSQAFNEGARVVHAGGLYYLDPEQGHLKNAYEYYRMGDRRAAMIIAIKGLTKAVWFKNFERYKRKMTPGLELIGAGGEALTIRKDDWVKKYLTAKPVDAQKLAPEVKRRHDDIEPYLRNFMPPTEVTVESAKLFKNDRRPQTYVTMTQPYIEIEHLDPQNNQALLDANPQMREQLLELAYTAAELYKDKGYILDFINEGNVVWGKVAGGESRLYYLDTLCAHVDDKDMPGLPASRIFWSPEVYVGYLEEFVARQDPSFELSRPSV